MLCHSVLSCRLPSASVHISDVAIGKRATARPVEVKRTSGSFPKLPIRIALFTDIRGSPTKNRSKEQLPYRCYDFQSITKSPVIPRFGFHNGTSGNILSRAKKRPRNQSRD